MSLFKTCAISVNTDQRAHLLFEQNVQKSLILLATNIDSDHSQSDLNLLWSHMS